MGKLRLPLQVAAIWTLIIGVVALSPALTRAVFGYEVKDYGAALVAAGFGLGFAVVAWAVANDIEKYGGLAQAIVLAIVIGIVITAWGWLRGTYTARNAILPIVVNVVLAAWVWSARPKS